MLNFIFFTINANSILLLIIKIIFLIIGIVYILYVLLQLRQIGIMNNTLKTSAGVPIAIFGVIHVLFVISIVIAIEILLFSQG